jgi:hypothetical protein
MQDREADEMSDDPISDSIAELRAITECHCDPAWTERQMHAPDCVAYCRADVETLAAEVERLREERQSWAAEVGRISNMLVNERDSA